MKNVILSEKDISEITHQKDSLVTFVYEEVVRRLICGELISGDIINRRQLAEELNVSVAPVLEAIVHLEQEGFIVTIPRKGTVIKPVREIDAFSQLLIREGFEASAVKLYHGKPVRKYYDQFAELANRMDAMSNQNRTRELEFHRSEISFHASLVNLCGMPIFTREFIRTIRTGVFSNINRINAQISGRQCHKDLLDKLTTEDEAEAIEAIKSHLWSGKPLLRNIHLPIEERE